MREAFHLREPKNRLEPVIRSGSILIFRVFDVAEEIRLPIVEKVLNQARGEARVRIAPDKPEAVTVRDAPIRVHLGGESLLIAGIVFSAEVLATIWSYGAISIRYRIPMIELPWRQLMVLAKSISEGNRIEGSDIRCQNLIEAIRPALERPMISPLVEDYSIYVFQEIDEVATGRDLIEQVDLPSLLLGETQTSLSDRMRAGIDQGIFQYGERDASLIDWNSAVIFEKDGGDDVIDILEFALSHLLELRMYDGLLDQRLTEIYDAIKAGRKKIWRSPYGAIAREVNTRYIEFSELMEQIDNSFKVVGDFYLAAIFRGAVQRLRIPDWQQNIARKMNILASVSGILQGEMNVRRSHFLEIIIILLIMFEIVMAMLRSSS